MQSLKEFAALLRETYGEWNADKAPRLGAALAYYTIFSMAPLLVVVMGIAGVFYDGADAALQRQITEVVGRDAAAAIFDVLRNAHRDQSSGAFATAIGLATLLLGAGGLFGQLQDALNTIWEVEPKPGQGLMATVRNRFLSFSMVLGTGFVLLVSLFISALLAGLSGYVGGALPVPAVLMQIANFAVSFAVVTLLFAMIYKLLPDVKIAWHDVWIGAAMTALLFNIGNFALGLYLGRSSVASAYGAAGSLAVLLLWIYYASQILFFGAEFTQVYARRRGTKIVPADNAVARTEAPEGLSVPLHPRGLPTARRTPRAQVLDNEFLAAAALGFVGVLLLRRRR